MEKADFTKTELPYMYIAKAVAIIAIVIGNTLTVGSVHRLCLAFHIPLFFVIAGIGFEHKEKYRDFLIEKIKKLFVPYFSFGLIAIIIYLLSGFHDFSFSDLLLQLVYGSAKIDISGNGFDGLVFYPPLWFLPALFVCENITYIIEKIPGKNKNRRGFILITLFSVLAFLNIYLFEIDGLPFGFETAVGLMPFMIMGRLFAKNPQLEKHAGKKPIPLLIWSALTFVSGVFFALSKSEVYYSKDCYGKSIFDGLSVFETPVPDTFGMYIISATLLCFGIIGFSMAASKSRLLEYIGKNTICIFLIHRYFVLLFKEHIPFISRVLTFSSGFLNEAVATVVAVILSAVIMIICLILGEFIKRFLPFLLGYGYKKIEVQK